MIDLSIILISYNTKEITRKCLETIASSLKKAPFTTEVVVLDNQSTDGSVEMIQNFSKIHKSKELYVTPLISQKNLGYAKGNNYAVSESKGKYILILNSDIEVLDEAIQKLYTFFIQQHHYDFVGAKLFNADMTPQSSAAPFYSLPIVFAALFLKGDYWGFTRYSPTSIRSVDWVSGACFLTTRKKYNEVGGFDERIFMYMEEVDFFYRARKKGLKVGFYPESHFIHLGSASSRGRTQPMLQVYRGFIYFYRKHKSFWELYLLKSMLKLKAVIAIFFGKMQQKMHPSKERNYLLTTYEEAYTIAKDN